MRRLVQCVALSTLLVSCLSTARVTGDFGDYQSYRRTRLAPTLEERLGAAERYLRDYPNGDYRAQVRSFLLPAEKRYYKLSWNNLPRLRAYLDAMPKGPHAEAVAERITELESRRVFADRREQRMLDVAHGFESRLAQAAEQRHQLLREFSTLTRLLGETRSFGQPTSGLASALLLRFGIRQSGATCAGDLCSQRFSFQYAVPDDKLLTQRVADVELQIKLERGLVRELSVAGPELLTRVGEAVEVSAVKPNSPQARAEALAHALDVVADALDVPLPEAHCRVDAVSPVVLARRCTGVELEVVAGTEAGAVDRLSVSAERRGKP